MRVLLMFALLLGNGLCWNRTRVLSDEFIDEVNIQASWTAGRNFHRHSSLKNLFSVFPARQLKLPAKESQVVHKLPVNFDARTKWKRCGSLKDVLSQGNCASAWAVSVAALYRDRLCISNKTKAHISSQYLMSCCEDCGQGCFGGYLDSALQYLKNHGVPSGGHYGKGGCQSYTVGPCATQSGTILCHKVRELTGWCYERSCFKGKFQQSMMTKCQAVFSVRPQNVRSEIFKNGPVLGVMAVYEDFFIYKSGVYRHVLGDMVGTQEVKIIGWGNDRETNEKYWLIVNSWGKYWGYSGVMKIARGGNECDLEHNVFSLSV